MKPLVSDALALMLVRQFLAGLRNYPARPEGETLLAETVQEVAVSIEHARRFLRQFDNFCPTPREIKDAAVNTKAQMFPPPDQRKEWEREYGAPKPFPALVEVTDAGEQDRRMWRAIKERLGIKDFSGCSWGQVYLAMQELGYPLNNEQRNMIGGSKLPSKPPAREEITEAQLNERNGGS